MGHSGCGRLSGSTTQMRVCGDCSRRTSAHPYDYKGSQCKKCQSNISAIQGSVLQHGGGYAFKVGAITSKWGPFMRGVGYWLGNDPLWTNDRHFELIGPTSNLRRHELYIYIYVLYMYCMKPACGPKQCYISLRVCAIGVCTIDTMCLPVLRR